MTAAFATLSAEVTYTALVATISSDISAQATSTAIVRATSTALSAKVTSIAFSAEATSTAIARAASTALSAEATFTAFSAEATSTAKAVLPTPTAIPEVEEYQVEIEQLDAQEFNVKEEAFTDSDELIDSQEREVESTSSGLILRELHITPSEPLCISRCPKSMVVLLDFPIGSFYQAKEVGNIEKESYVGTETIRWSVRDLDRGITFAYIPAPYHHLRPFLIPFIEFASFSSWLIGFGGFMMALFINPMIKPLLPYINNSKRKEGTARRPASPGFDLLSQATCAVLIDGEIAGTAWLTSNEGHLITAGHVLGEDEPLSQVQVQFEGDYPRIAHQIRRSFQPNMGIDFAILQLDSPIDKRQSFEDSGLPISLAKSVEGKCRLVGYGKTLTDRSQGVGEFVGFHDRENSADNRLFRLRSPELAEEGYSGGAVFSEELAAVVAIQTEATRRNLGAGRDTVLAMPLYRVAHHWKPLIGLAEKKRTNSRWRLVSSK